MVIVPSSFDYDSQTQQPVDRWQRKELNHAVVEYIAPAEYMVRPPQPLVYLFVIDVSYPAIQCGMVATAATTILESLDRIPNDEGRTKIGIITVDSSIHFYNLNVRIWHRHCVLLFGYGTQEQPIHCKYLVYVYRMSRASPRCWWFRIWRTPSCPSLRIYCAT